MAEATRPAPDVQEQEMQRLNRKKKMPRKYGTKQSELNEIARDRAVAQRNSGRGKTAKGDAVIDDYFLVDYKETAKSFVLSMTVWAKLCTDAVKSGNLQPVLKVILGADTKNKVRLFVISEDDMIEYRRLRSEEAEAKSLVGMDDSGLTLPRGVHMGKPPKVLDCAYDLDHLGPHECNLSSCDGDLDQYD